MIQPFSGLSNARHYIYLCVCITPYNIEQCFFILFIVTECNAITFNVELNAKIKHSTIEKLL